MRRQHWTGQRKRRTNVEGDRRVPGEPRDAPPCPRSRKSRLRDLSLPTLSRDAHDPTAKQATTLVMDEADMLMDGSYKKELDGILTAFKRADRVRVEDPESFGHEDGVRLRGIEKTQYGEMAYEPAVESRGAFVVPIPACVYRPRSPILLARASLRVLAFKVM